MHAAQGVRRPPTHALLGCRPGRRLHETTVVTYMLLPTALARLPLVGSLVAFPAAALGAHALADIVARSKGLDAVLAEAGAGGGHGE